MIAEITAMWPSPTKPMQSKWESLDEVKHFSIEVEAWDHTGNRWPRDSVEPIVHPSIGLGGSDEQHNGQLRNTDELVHSIGQPRNSKSPFVKQEPSD